MIKSDTFGHLWLRYLRYVIDHGVEQIDDKGLIHEAPHVLLELVSPDDYQRDPIILKHGDGGLIRKYILKLQSDQHIDGFPISYGVRLRKYRNEINQIDWLIARLKRYESTKSACISLLLGGEDGPIPCLVAISVKVRHNKVGLTAVFRSQNAINGYANIISLSLLQHEIAGRLGKNDGPLVIDILSPHIPVAKMELAREICATQQ